MFETKKGVNRLNVDVILPAGGRISGDFAAAAGTDVKALLPVGGRTLLERTVETIRATGRARRLVVIGPGEVASHAALSSLDAVLPDLDSGPSNILRGIEWLRDTDGGQAADRVLIVTSDLPFLTPEAVTDFIDACPPETDLCVPLVTRETFDARFPDIRTQYVRLRDGEWTMGSAFLVNPAAVEANRTYIENAFAARKSQFGMVRMLGLPFVVRFLMGRLTIAHIQDRCQHMLGCSGAGIRDGAPELAFDIDSIEEYEYAARCCARTGMR